MSRLHLSFLLYLVPLVGWAESLNLTIDDIQKWEPIGIDGRVGAPATIQEKVMGKADFIQVAALPEQHPDKILSEKIGIFLDPVRKTKCSGSLVGPDLFLTNHHCVANPTGGVISTEGIAVWMEYLGNSSEFSTRSTAYVDQILSFDKSLDYALLKLNAPLGNHYGWLQLEENPNQIQNVRSVKIIQHPRGRAKEIVLENTEVVNCGQDARSSASLCYLADTEGGSSGSPVFSIDGDTIIALHNSGVEGRFNVGTQGHFIKEKIRQFLPAAGPVRQAPAATPTATPPAHPTHPTEPPAEDNQDWKPII